MRTAFADELENLAHTEPVMLVTGDLGFGVFESFAGNHPKKFLNAGITEQSLTSMAAGLVDEGFVPFVYSIANFPTLRNYEQIRNDIAYPGRHAVVVSVGAGLAYGSLGFSHFGVEDIGVMRLLPNFRVLTPSDPKMTRLAVQSSVGSQSPAYLRLGKNGEKDFGRHPRRFSEIRAISLGDESADLLVLTSGSLGKVVQEIVQSLSTGRVTHYSVEQCWPLSERLLRIASSFSKILVIEEHIREGGLFSILSEATSGKKGRPALFWSGVERDSLKLSGSHDYLLAATNLSGQALTAKIEELLFL